jgi:hypothetical protein
MRHLVRAAIALAVLYGAANAYRIYVRKYYLWLPGYVSHMLSSREPPRGPVHILFYFTDHFEPAGNRNQIVRWQEDYPKLASRHRDSTSRPPQHTWFYPGEQPDDFAMTALQKLVAAGYGEVELHYHHFGDNDESTRQKFAKAIAYFQQFGFLKTVNGQTRFGFIHGNWALDNSMPWACGSNHELRILRELGAFADYTFPSIFEQAQPSWVNAIAMATDDDGPKSYNRAVPVRAGQEPAGDLMLLEGPLGILPSLTFRHLFWDVEDGNIHPGVVLSPRRVDSWIRANVHVEGRPEWVFVKVHGHEASSDAERSNMLGAPFERVLTYLETRYNDGRNYILHYITAREAYNLARAAAAGKQGDPTQFLDWVVPPYVADPARPAGVSKAPGETARR